jgi:hypothetical protein
MKPGAVGDRLTRNDGAVKKFSQVFSPAVRFGAAGFLYHAHDFAKLNRLVDYTQNPTRGSADGSDLIPPDGV